MSPAFTRKEERLMGSPGNGLVMVSGVVGSAKGPDEDFTAFESLIMNLLASSITRKGSITSLQATVKK
ncbi:hypothetical protein D3C85_1388170 [compost metagenome]